MARRPVIVQKPPVATFYVIKDVPGGKLGGTPIVDKGDNKTVTMSAEEARYWLDQGVLSTVDKATVEARRSERLAADEQSPQPARMQETPKKEDPADQLSGGRKRTRSSE